jgi:hypothetical protein
MGGLWHWFTNIIFQWREFDPPIFHNFLGRSSLAAFQVPDFGDSKVVAGESSTGDQMLGNYKKLTIRSISYGISCPIDTLLYSQIPMTLHATTIRAFLQGPMWGCQRIRTPHICVKASRKTPSNQFWNHPIQSPGISESFQMSNTCRKNLGLHKGVPKK